MSITEVETQTTPRMPSHREVVLRAREQLDLPEGWRAEIVEGAIHIMAPSTDEHGHIEIVWLLNKVLIREVLREGSLRFPRRLSPLERHGAPALI